DTTCVNTQPHSSVKSATVILNTVGFDYFNTLGYASLGGRDFDEAHGEDIRPQGPPSSTPINVVIDASLADELGIAPPESAVGQDLYFPVDAQRAFGGQVSQHTHV